MSALRNCIVKTESLGFPYACADPFLFCVYHKDFYPPSTTKLRAGNGADFDFSQPYRMYHGKKLPGFPQHPHRGFETVTATLEGTVDHTDSMGSAGRYGGGDLQWMTAGRGVVHGENFPMINKDKPNTCRFFQIWINLPSQSKFVDPSYVMHWNEDIPRIVSDDGLSKVTVWAGQLGGKTGMAPPPHSWASKSSNDVSVLHISLQPGGRFSIPPAAAVGVNRTLYWNEGSSLTVGEKSIKSKCSMTMDPTVPISLFNPSTSSDSDGVTELLMLQGRPIGEPVVQRGPFVMNTAAEIQQAFLDYSRTQFGGWPWKEDAVTFSNDKGRFTLQNGVEEFPPGAESAAAVEQKQGERL